MNRAELMMKWPREEFEEMKFLGDFAASVTYEQFLDMKMAQAELARQQKIELFGEDLAEVPIEEPPDLTPEDEAALIEAWAQVAAERAAAEKESFMPAQAA